jgi:hypothetical protein
MEPGYKPTENHRRGFGNMQPRRWRICLVPKLQRTHAYTVQILYRQHHGSRARLPSWYVVILSHGFRKAY